MAFAKMDVESIIKTKREDKEFDTEYKKIKKEYELIEKLVEARKQRNITQQQLSKVTGISQQAISRIEKEKHIPKVDTLIRILDGLDLELTIVQK